MICLTTLVPCGWCSVLLQTCTLLEWILEHLSKDLEVFERYVVGILSETRWQWTYDLHILCLLGIALLTSSFAYSVVLRSAVSSVWTLFKLVSCKFFALLCLCSACTEWRFCVCVEVWSFSSLSMTLQSSHLMHLAMQRITDIGLARFNLADIARLERSISCVHQCIFTGTGK